MPTTAELTENSRQGFEPEKPDCTGLEHELSRYLRQGYGHVYDETPADLAVYVRNDPVNIIDPNGELARALDCYDEPEIGEDNNGQWFFTGGFSTICEWLEYGLGTGIRLVPEPEKKKEQPKCWRDITSAEGQAILEKARALIGKPVSYSGDLLKRGGQLDSNGVPMFDCSGFVCTIAGIPLENSTAILGDTLRFRNIDRSEGRNGDVVVFKNPGKAPHVGFYEGENRLVSMTSSGVRDYSFKELQPRNGNPTAWKRLQKEVECGN